MSTIVMGDGRLVDLAGDLVDQFTLAELWGVLAHVPRFGGRVGMYTVQQHSCLVSWLAQRKAEEVGKTPTAVWRAAAWGLLHDLHEALLGDVPTPLRPWLTAEWTTAAEKIDREVTRQAGLRVSEWVGIDPDTAAMVKYADQRALLIERAAFGLDLRWPGDAEPVPEDADVVAYQPPDGLRVMLRWNEVMGVDAWTRRRVACGEVGAAASRFVIGVLTLRPGLAPETAQPGTGGAA